MLSWDLEVDEPDQTDVGECKHSKVETELIELERVKVLVETSILLRKHSDGCQEGKTVEYWEEELSY